MLLKLFCIHAGEGSVLKLFLDILGRVIIYQQPLSQGFSVLNQNVFLYKLDIRL